LGPWARSVEEYIWAETEKEKPLVAMPRDIQEHEGNHTRVDVSVLRFHRHPAQLHDALLKSELAEEAQAQGCDIQPSWANGALVLCRVHLPSLPLLDLHLYNVMIKSKDIDRVLRTLRDALPYKQRPRVKNSYDIKARQEDVHGWDVEVSNTFVHIIAKCDTDDLESTVAYAKSANDLISGCRNPRAFAPVDSLPIQPRSLTEHTEQMEVYHKDLDLPGAMQCYSNMLRDGLEPDTHVFSILIDLSFKAGEPQKGHDIFHSMVQNKVPPSHVTFDCIIRDFARRGKGKKAEKWLQRMATYGLEPTPLTYKFLIRAYSNQGNDEKVAEWQEILSKCSDST
jgi:pentatricopeptide repeat protein